MDATPSTSVITINRNREAHLARLIEGLDRGAAPLECIVVDMGSSTTRTDGFVRHVPLPGHGLPLASARNAGRRAASGEILVFLDVDCIPSADLTAALEAAVKEHDALICCEVYYLPEGAVTHAWTEAALSRSGVPHPARAFPTAGVSPAPHPGLFWSLAFAVRAETFDRIGGFDDEFTGYGAEDTDFAFRAAAINVPTLFAGAGRAFHQRHESFDPPIQHVGDIVKNAARFHRRHGFWPMPDWLAAFSANGLIEYFDDGHITLLREAKPEEIEAARVPPTRPF
ncbi:glycosyltransferase family 2 protein [Beijerinckia sp. L45]|uniref:glycosyltransferase family 2 protein n=1 Tax=Beijerinckia sp. L45 TaxID=1641855 RepID=UPI00131E18E9|nr:glycosyltransferase [Beijerinckia sp. L45]